MSKRRHAVIAGTTLVLVAAVLWLWRTSRPEPGPGRYPEIRLFDQTIGFSGGEASAEAEADAGAAPKKPMVMGEDPDFRTPSPSELTAPREVYAAERRDEVWAPVMERRLLAILAADVATGSPGARVGSVECRTTVCRVVAEPAAEEDLPALNALELALQLPGHADFIQLEGTVVGYFGFTKEHRAPGAHARWAEEDRTLGMPELRDAGYPLPER